MSQSRQVLVLADDLTGANDTAVQFARLGWRAYLALTPAGEQAFAMELPLGSSEPIVVARSAGTRAETPVRAAELTEAAVTASPLERLYLKIDSTMRGSVTGQIQGALRARRRTNEDAFVVLCPAYPAMGRAVREGTILVGGEPAHRGPAGQDPITPIATSALTDLVPSSAALPNAATADALAAAILDEAAGTDCVVVDAETEEDLHRLARALELIGDRALPAGSAGLALASAVVWSAGLEDSADVPAWSMHVANRDRNPGRRHTVIAVSSQHRVAHDQVRAALSVLHTDRISTATATWEDVKDPEAARKWAHRLVRAQETPIRILLPPPLVSGGDDAVKSGRAVAEALATAVGELVALHPGSVDLVLVGGDGAAAVLNELGAEALLVTGAIVEGVPATTIVGGPHAGLGVATKAGGFGDDSTLIRILSQLNPELVGALS